jgi:hypothetical protein
MNHHKYNNILLRIKQQVYYCIFMNDVIEYLKKEGIL